MAEKPELVAKDPLSWDLFQVFDAFPAVLDRHVVEFFPGWHGPQGYHGRTLGMDAISFEGVIEWGDKIFERMANEAYSLTPLAKEREAGEHSQLVEILSAIWNDANRFYSVNLPNTGQVSNLPLGAVLEGTTLVNASGFHPLSFGPLPPGITAILQRVIGVQELTVAAALKGDYRLLVQALLAEGHVLTRQQAEDLSQKLAHPRKLQRRTRLDPPASRGPGRCRAGCSAAVAATLSVVRSRPKSYLRSIPKVWPWL